MANYPSRSLPTNSSDEPEREGLINIWHNGHVQAGEITQEVIDEHLNRADIALLMLSASCEGTSCIQEIKTAEQRREESGACVVPVVVRPCNWLSFFAIRAKVPAPLPKGQKSLADWEEEQQDKPCLEIAEAIREIVETRRAKAASGRTDRAKGGSG